MEKYDFNRIISRKGTYSEKWQDINEIFAGYNTEDVLSMWVADMDFLCPKEVINAVKKRAEHGIYGYTSLHAVKAFKKAAAGWYKRRYGYNTDTKWMLFFGGVMPAINATIQEFTEPGDGVILQQPVYYPFNDSVVNCGRKIQINQLLEEDGRYTIDFENLEKLVRNNNNKLIILCNPHNPVGRVWNKDELYDVCKLCYDNNVLIFSDEIHSDLIMQGHTFFSAGMLPSDISEKLIIAFSPSKAFNIAGLGAAIIIVPQEHNRKRLEKRILINRYPDANLFGLAAGEAAYLYGDNYVDELINYVEHNIDFVIDFSEKHLKDLRIVKPEGTYLTWIDFRKTGMSSEEIYSFVLEKTKIAADLGKWFGSGGDGFVRFNFACPKTMVEEAMNRLKNNFANL